MSSNILSQIQNIMQKYTYVDKNDKKAYLLLEELSDGSKLVVDVQDLLKLIPITLNDIKQFDVDNKLGYGKYIQKWIKEGLI